MPDDNPFRQFYEQGGYVGDKTPSKRLRMALWGSQYMADGGSVPPNESGRMPPLNLAYGSQYFADGGRTKSLNEVVRAITKLNSVAGGKSDLAADQVVPPPHAFPPPLTAQQMVGKEKGYNFDRPLYHGTRADIQNFEPRRASRNEQMALKGTHLVEDPAFAGKYAEGVGGNIMPVVARGKYLDAQALVAENSEQHKLLEDLLRGTRHKPFWDKTAEGTRVAPPLVSYLDMVSPARAERILREYGYDGVDYTARYGTRSNTSMTAPATVVFDPVNIKSRFAQFADDETPDVSKAEGGRIKNRRGMK